MKKYFKLSIILLLVSFIIPQVVFASWWNPFSWFIKPQEIIQNPTSQTPPENQTNTTNTQIQTTNTPESKTAPKDVQTQSGQSELIAQLQQTISDLRKQLLNSQCPICTKYTFLTTGAVLDDKGNIVQSACQTCPTCSNTTSAIDQNLSTNLANQQAAQQAAAAKQAELNAINLEIANLNAKYAQDIKNCSSGIGQTTSFVYACENQVTRTYNNDYNALSAKFQQIKYGN
jgi:hypothetical protein